MQIYDFFLIVANFAQKKTARHRSTEQQIDWIMGEIISRSRYHHPYPKCQP